MSKVNRGKQFEKQIQNAFEKVENCSIDRLPDPMAGYAGVRNICDFTVYKYPLNFYLECKCCYGDRFPLSNITENQWNGLLDKSCIPGIVSGYFIWFIDHDITIYVSAKFLNTHYESGSRSITIRDMLNWKDLPSNSFMFIRGNKKRIFFDYDMNHFLNEQLNSKVYFHTIETNDIYGNITKEYFPEELK